MHTTSSYGEYYTKVFYISLCLNGSVREETFKHPIFRFEKGSQSNAKLPLEPNNTTKIRTLFVIANFIHLFSFPYVAIITPQKKSKNNLDCKLFFVSLHP